MDKPTLNDHPLHELLRARWSPVAFSERLVPRETLLSVLEAARWAPSAYNAQPWHIILATRDDAAEFERLAQCMVEPNQRWARHAPVLMLLVAERNYAHNNQPNAHYWYDTGQAAAHLTVEATAAGLVVHQMAGFVPAQARTTYAIPDTHEPAAMLALGYPGDPVELPEDLQKRDAAPRQRKPLASFVFGGTWGQKAAVLG